MTSDNAIWQQDAARLREYTVLLAHKDLRLRGVKLPDLQELRRQWDAKLKAVPKRPLSPTVPASSLPANKAPRVGGAATTADDGNSSLRSADMIRCRLAIVHTRRILAHQHQMCPRQE